MTTLGIWVHRTANILALIGGIILVVASVITCISIIGSVTYKPLPGEIELVEALCGIAVFAFMPFCQLHRGHVSVDLLIGALGNRATLYAQLVGDIVIAVLFAIVTWRHWVGTLDKMRNGETTTILELPVWWGFVAGLVLLIATVAISIYVIFVDIRDLKNDARIAVQAGDH